MTTWLRGFFRCACGKIHCYAFAYGAKCPACGVELKEVMPR